MEEPILYLSAAVNIAKAGTRDIIAAPGAGFQLWIYGFIGTTNDAGTILLLDSTPTSRTGVMPMGTNSGIPFPKDTSNVWAPYFKCATNTKLQATLSANSDFDGIVIYRIHPATLGHPV